MSKDEMLARATHVFVGVIQRQQFESWPFFHVRISGDDPASAKFWKVLRREVRVEMVLRGVESRKVVNMLMRHTGLRISDAATFNADKILADGISLYMKKTDEPVTIPIHPELKAALDAVQPNERGYYFTTGECAVTTATDNWRWRFEQVFKAAGIEGGHPHRFRHSFAVDLLLRDVPIDQVSVLLGHSSVKITEKHYLSFVAARRNRFRTL